MNRHRDCVPGTTMNPAQHQAMLDAEAAFNEDAAERKMEKSSEKKASKKKTKKG